VKPAAVVRHFDRRFREVGTARRAEGAKAYMKSALRFHGVDAAQLRTECVAFCKAHPDMDRDGLIACATALFATDAFDIRSVAIALLERKWKLLQASDAPWLVELARAGACWAHVDFLATAVIDPLLEREGGVATWARAWANDDSFWVRRVALLCQLRSLRRGAGDFALFSHVAAPMLSEKEFFIRKAIGWVLRDTAHKRPDMVFEWLLPRAARASGVTLREAGKPLSAEQRAAIEAARRG
jgi:3-methyladenine DNA glycosylase AlkD